MDLVLLGPALCLNGEAAGGYCKESLPCSNEKG